MNPGQPTYEVQWQKITSAYVNDELKPLEACACFIGNLLNNKGDWFDYKGSSVLANCLSKYHVTDHVAMATFLAEESGGLYSPEDIVLLEENFMNVRRFGITLKGDFDSSSESNLYEAMTSTLELLRQIHLAHGDETAIEIPLTKRQLVAA